MYSAPQLAIKYLQYYISALNSKGHGVHSPFVFDFIKHIKNDETQYDCYTEIESLRKQLLNNTDEIMVEDFGAGSTQLKTSKRTVNKIAKSSLKPKKFGQLLFRMVQAYKPATVIELGTSLGITSAYLANGNKHAKLTTFEGSPAIASIAQKNFKALGILNIELIKGNFDDTITPFLEKTGKVDFAFIDGNHRKVPTLNYFNQILEKSHEDTILVFDDIHWSREMEQAWQEIITQPRVSLSIDLFFLGIVFFKRIFSDKHQLSIRY